MRFIAKYRHVITVIMAVFCFAGLFFAGKRMKELKNPDVNADTFSGTAMGTAVRKTIYAESRAKSEQVDAVIDDCLEETEKQISVRLSDSVVAKCNRNYAVDGIYEMPLDLLEYVEKELEIFRETKGAFSPCIRPIADLWGIEDGNDIVPEEKTIEETLEVCDASNIDVEDGGIIFHEDDMAIDFGAVGKGIAGDRIVSELQKTDIQGAVVSVGGSIAVYGNKGDGRPWHIGIQDPRGQTGEVFGVIDIEGNKMISTSGDYEKYFEADGKRYHHIFDPSTGYPVDNGLISVTIVSDNGFLSDALSTACFVLGLEKGMAYAEEKNVDAVFVTSQREVYVTGGMKKAFRIQSDQYHVNK